MRPYEKTICPYCKKWSKDYRHLPCEVDCEHCGKRYSTDSEGLSYELTEEYFQTLKTQKAKEENKAKKIEKIKELLDEAKSNYEYGGDEDQDGCLERGDVDFDKLKEQIIKIVEDESDKEFNIK